MSLFGKEGSRKPPQVVKGLDKTNRDESGLELGLRGYSKTQHTCVLCIGSKGSGKTATINRFELSEVDNTNNCTMYRPENGIGPTWIEVGDWDLTADDTEDCFHDTLELLLNHSITRIQAIFWLVIPSLSQNNMTLYEQARFINMFRPRDIWSNVILVCKMSMHPERDGKEALRTASEFAPEVKIPVAGYRFMEDPSFSASEKEKFSSPERRLEFKIKDRKEVRALLEDHIVALGGPCSMDDDERELSVIQQKELKTVFGLPPIVFPKPF
ncbi:hypothetical protein TCAL_14982 [Tigriopus californicus]|uniref:Cytoplasmic dynein 2 light intermediate chain 1 n=1 Tax=Tigriopus californicus TaxID=6832 RepID=A0A553N9J3_TIGCA|nr:hypothetical protein TCAL_14982 [Tigriopus californicus]